MKMLETAEGVVLDVFVKPNSRKFKIEIQNDELVVSCRQAPVGGRVNKELVNEFSRLFKRRVIIVSGSTSRQKRILVKSVSEEEVRQFLSGCFRM